MVRIIKATNAEKVAYRVNQQFPCTLYGWIKMNSQTVPVEYLGEGQDNPNYEVIAPRGFVFDADETHTLIGFTLADMHERIASNNLIVCHCEECA